MAEGVSENAVGDVTSSDNPISSSSQNEEAASANVTSSDDPYHFTDPTGTEYEWDQNMQAWVPKIDDLVIANYQAHYGTAADSSSTNQVQTSQPASSSNGTATQPTSSDSPQATTSSDKPSDESTAEAAKKRKAEEKDPTWFEIDDEHNTHVYVSNLPLTTTEDEFITFMQKCGLVMREFDSNKYKIKMYKDKEGNFKGDALCGYIKRESVDLALQLLDESTFNGNVISVELAKFELKGSYDPSKKPRKNKKSKDKMKKKIEKLFDWRPEKQAGERSKSEKVVIIKNMFDIKEFMSDPRLILEYRTDLREECDEKCGAVRKVEIYDTNPEGVAAIHFHDFEPAEKCVRLMNGRFFAGRQLVAFHWDGKTRYKIEETEEEVEKRMKDWEDFLEADSANAK